MATRSENLDTAIRERLSIPRTYEGLRKHLVQSLGFTSPEVGEALAVFFRRGEAVLYPEDGQPTVALVTDEERRGHARAMENQPSNLVALSGPTPEERAAVRALKLLRDIDDMHGQIAAAESKVSDEKKRIQPDIDRVSAKLTALKEDRKALQESLEALKDERDNVARVLVEELKQAELPFDAAEAKAIRR